MLFKIEGQALLPHEGMSAFQVCPSFHRYKRLIFGSDSPRGFWEWRPKFMLDDFHCEHCVDFFLAAEIEMKEWPCPFVFLILSSYAFNMLPLNFICWLLSQFINGVLTTSSLAIRSHSGHRLTFDDELHRKKYLFSLRIFILNYRGFSW